ncbi:MAG: hypothetical protein IPM00_10635 [Tetrasphaera sp.]|nr:hypothetical protein [Tetrasphaera sp.]
MSAAEREQVHRSGHEQGQQGGRRTPVEADRARAPAAPTTAGAADTIAGPSRRRYAALPSSPSRPSRRRIR